MKTSVTELPESRVRVEVEVDAADVEHSLEHAAGHLAEDMRMPGFRKGKVPPQLVLQRLGRETVLDAALREFLPSWYERALLDTGISPIGDPSLDVSELPAAGQPLEFSIEVAVRPVAQLGEYRGLEVGKADPDVPDDAVQSELDRLREGFASLTPVDRAAGEGDLVVIDYAGSVDGESFEGGEGHDQLVELGSGSLVDGFEDRLMGAKAGEERQVEVTFPEDYRAEELAGKAATFAVTVKEVREKEMPDLDDDFAQDASEFETLDELRAAIRERIGEAFARRSDEEFRSAAVDAAAANATVELPDEVVSARAEDSLERFLHRLSHQGVDPETFLKVQEGGREGMLNQIRPDAEKALRREATLAAIADAEQIEVTDDDLLEALGPGEQDQDPEQLLRRLRESGRDGLLVEEVRMRKAAELVAESAKPIPLEQAAAREQIWTPEQERGEEEATEGGEAAGGLWTPGSD
jgi:trigger factor